MILSPHCRRAFAPYRQLGLSVGWLQTIQLPLQVTLGFVAQRRSGAAVGTRLPEAGRRDQRIARLRNGQGDLHHQALFLVKVGFAKEFGPGRSTQPGP